MMLYIWKCNTIPFTKLFKIYYKNNIYSLNSLKDFNILIFGCPTIMCQQHESIHNLRLYIFHVK